ncbi:MAG: hypothetical protein B6247_15130 [Candidatus Parabeggiatoa sp. nov. 2]|nr:MAG: hypothetical protein B6247_15130 [Beggiatoa sp. 4572_84]
MTERISQDFSKFLKLSQKFLKLSQSKETETEIETKDFSEQRNDRKNFSIFFNINFSSFLRAKKPKQKSKRKISQSKEMTERISQYFSRFLKLSQDFSSFLKLSQAFSDQRNSQDFSCRRNRNRNERFLRAKK